MSGCTGPARGPIVQVEEGSYMQEKLWIFSVRYLPEGVRDFFRRAVVGPAGSLTVETALHLAGIPEAVRVEIRSDPTVRCFIEGVLDFEKSGYYAPTPFLLSQPWIVCIGPVHATVSAVDRLHRVGARDNSSFDLGGEAVNDFIRGLGGEVVNDFIRGLGGEAVNDSSGVLEAK